MVITLEPGHLGERDIGGIRYLQFHGRNEEGDGFLVWVDISVTLWEETYTLAIGQEDDDVPEMYSGEVIRATSAN
jgi:hypothetical protein